MLAGFLVVAFLTDLPNGVAGLFGGHFYDFPALLPKIAFPWRIAFGTVTTYAVAVLFRTPELQVLEEAAQIRRQQES
jgi:hypothetical protein